jgi:excinuclease ABC subunit B
MLHLEKGKTYNRQRVLHQIVDMQYERNDIDFSRGKFRIRGDTLEILPAYEEIGLRIEFFGDEVERIVQIDPLTGELLTELNDIDIYPAKHFVTSHDKLLRAIDSIELELKERIAELKSQDKLLEAARLEQRTNYDLEMLRESGYCNGVENYSRHLSERAAGTAPWTLMDYFPEDYLLMIDESHMTLPQIRGMFHGDLSRKQTLIDFGFRLPSAKDNRPLNYDEFEQRFKQVIYVSATPSPYEFIQSKQVAEQLVRPTGLLEPTIEIKSTKGQIDDLLEQVKARIAKGERCLVTTLTKRMAEELADYLIELDIKTHYLHSEVDTFERVEILRDLRLGVYDVVVGINLLREGLDLPEVSLVTILDADKEGFLRSEGALIQTMGRAARHVDGHVIMYADTITKSMQAAINEIQRRRKIQEDYNLEHGITPKGIKKAIRDITERVAAVAETKTSYVTTPATKEGIIRLVKELEAQMKIAAKALDFEKAALIRDRIFDLRKNLDPIDINPRKKYGKR